MAAAVLADAAPPLSQCSKEAMLIHRLWRSNPTLVDIQHQLFQLLVSATVAPEADALWQPSVALVQEFARALAHLLHSADMARDIEDLYVDGVPERVHQVQAAIGRAQLGFTCSI
jgi:hypothetical protein